MQDVQSKGEGETAKHQNTEVLGAGGGGGGSKLAKVSVKINTCVHVTRM